MLSERESIKTATGRLHPRVTPVRVHSPQSSASAGRLPDHRHPRSMTSLVKSLPVAAMVAAKLVTKLVSKPPRHAAEPSGNAQAARCQTSRTARTLPQRAGLCETAARRLVEPLDRARRHRRSTRAHKSVIPMATESSPYVTLRRRNARPHHRTSGDHGAAQPGCERHGQASPPSRTATL